MGSSPNAESLQKKSMRSWGSGQASSSENSRGTPLSPWAQPQLPTGGCGGPSIASTGETVPACHVLLQVDSILPTAGLRCPPGPRCHLPLETHMACLLPTFSLHVLGPDILSNRVLPPVSSLSQPTPTPATWLPLHPGSSLTSRLERGPA